MVKIEKISRKSIESTYRIDNDARDFVSEEDAYKYLYMRGFDASEKSFPKSLKKILLKLTSDIRYYELSVLNSPEELKYTQHCVPYHFTCFDCFEPYLRKISNTVCLNINTALCDGQTIVFLLIFKWKNMGKEHIEICCDIKQSAFEEKFKILAKEIIAKKIKSLQRIKI